jgi:AcrR family transcriptional regulator
MSFTSSIDQGREQKRFTVKGERTRCAILDAAERQFSERGYDGVSLRQVMQEASVQMGQLQYYFPSKEQVFVSVLERRLPEVIQCYTAALANLEGLEASGALDLRAVVRAVMATSRDWMISDDVGKHRYLKMLGLSTLSFTQLDFVATHTEAFKPLNDTSVGWIARLYPGVPTGRIMAAYYLIESSLLSLYVEVESIFARTGRERNAAAVADMYDGLETFLVGGVEKLLSA